MGDGDKDRGRIRVDGFVRTYHVYLPSGYNESTNYPLVFVLHGAGGTGKNLMKRSFINHKADEQGFIVCYPDGYKKKWADDRNYGTAYDAGIDDVKFFDNLLDKLIDKYSVDEQRVYSCGMSNGGFMSLSLACHLSNRFAAVASVTGNMGLEPETYCSSAAPTGVLLIAGKDDPIVPYEGGQITGNESQTIGFPASFDFWVNQNNCVDMVTDSTWADLDQNDGTSVITHSHFDCDSSVQVILYEILGGGHTWPQLDSPFDEDWVGKVSQEINATEVILEFLFQHTLE